MNLFTQIETLIPTLHGWCSIAKANALAGAVLSLRPEISLEIGIWGGRSFLPLALAHREINFGTAIGIDPWDAKASQEGQTGENLKFWSQTTSHELVYNDFMAKAKSLGMLPAKVYRTKSDNIQPPARIDLMSLDGNHGPQAERDVSRFCPNIRRGGLVFVDDLDWDGGAVRRAVAALKQMGFIQLYILDTGAVFQRL